MINNIKNSLAFRLPMFYMALLNHLPIFGRRLKKRPCHDYCVVIFSGSKQLAMLKQCLNSIDRNFERLPEVCVCMDLDLDIKQCREALSHYTGRLSLMSGADCLNDLAAKGEARLLKFARSNTMGLKMAFILQQIDSGKTVLYCDTDVLWFNDPWPALHQYVTDSDFELAMSADYQPAYDDNILEKASLDHLKDTPFYCAGIMLLRKFSSKTRNSLEKLLIIAENNSNHFTEQTIFAALNRLGRGLLLDATCFIIKTDDQFRLRPQRFQDVVARHYIGPVRHLFWRDALWQN